MIVALIVSAWLAHATALKNRTAAPAQCRALAVAALLLAGADAYPVGAAGRLAGYVVATNHEADGDWHVEVAATPRANRAHSVVCEITPRVPVAVPAVGSRVTVSGWLFYDAHHLHQPGRGTCWEIHPVTSAVVFTGCVSARHVGLRRGVIFAAARSCIRSRPSCWTIKEGRMRMKNVLLALLFLLVAVVAFAAVPAPSASAVTPESVRLLFDSFASIIMLLVGLAYSRLPALKHLPNAAIPWVNLVLYILGRIAVPEPAQAGVLSSVGHGLSLAWIVARGGATSALTSLAYDKFIKPWLDQVAPAAVPHGGWPLKAH